MITAPFDYSPFAGSRCLVTGGLGFIGSNLVVQLLDAGAHVTVVDSLVPTHGGNPRNVQDIPIAPDIIVADIADYAALAIVASRCDFVFNLAGQVSHIDSMENPVFDLEVNARSHLGFLELLRRVNPDASVVYSSTRQIYGRPKYDPVDESHPFSPVDVNGISKYAGEQYHILYAQTYGMSIRCLRLTNTYGPRQRLRDDRQGFLPIFIRRALEDQPLTVYGSGEQVRECMHVADVVTALCASVLNKDASGEVFNISSADALAMQQIAEIIVKHAGSGSVQNIVWPIERARIDIGNYRGDSSKAKRVLGWQPSVDFETGIDDTLDFYRKHIDWYL